MIRALVFISILALMPTTVSAAASESKKESGPLTAQLPNNVSVGMDVDFLTLGHFYNDSDFDASPRFLDSDGQTQGQVATFFKPTLHIDVQSRLKIAWQMELGWNAWSRNNGDLPNQFMPSDQPGIMLRHKELWAGYTFESDVSLAVGYQHFADPSRLFLDHWGGVLQLDFPMGDIQGKFLVGQLPDSTFEGVRIAEDNFFSDSFVAGFSATMKKGNYSMVAGLYGIGDWQLVDRPFCLGTALLGVDYKGTDLAAWFHGLVQVGSWSNSGALSVDQDIFGWAVQAGLNHDLGRFSYGANVFALSPDDSYDGNGSIGGFYGSGKNRSPSRILTEDETRDRYDNIDERVSTSHGPFFLNRAGLVVLDVHGGVSTCACHRLDLLVAAGVNLAPENAMGHRFVGLEIGLMNTFPVWKHVSLFLNVQTFLPGGGASVFVNDIEREATEPLFGGQLGFQANL